MKISFCTTCMGRVEHLKKTLPQNILDNPPQDGLEIEFVILNYNSPDDMDAWMKTEMAEHIASGLIRYARTDEPKHFNMSHAKNMAHRLGTGDILCNLDADNYTGKGFAKFIADAYRKDPNLVINPSVAAARNRPPEDRGFFGKVVIPREVYLAIGGYRETFRKWGEEDTDLLRRAKGYGMKHLRFEEQRFLRIIGHSNEERVKNWENPDGMDKALAEITETQKRASLPAKALKAFVVATTPVQANNGGEFGRGTVYLGLNEEQLALGTAHVKKLPGFYVAGANLAELFRGRVAPRILHEQPHAEEGPDMNILSPS